MSRDASDLRFVAANTLKNAQLESTENEFDNSMNSIHFPPPRTPLNTIPDPSQFQREFQELDFDSKDRFGAARAGRSSDRKIEVLENLLSLNKVIGNVSNCGTPRVSGRGKAQSEPSSAQSTPARSISRTLNGGVVGACSGHRPPPYSVGKGGSSSRVSRGISNPMSEPLVEVPHFEIVEDPSFWMDHNVQVLIRIRPISSVERASQGYGRCLRQESSQTILWLGHPETRFTFDHIACEKISQEKLFRVAGLPMVENCISGYNSCMFAYGQTGSGKTYTMMGEIYEMDRELNEDCGITPRIFEYLFTRIRAEEENRRDEKLKYSCKCSFLEIYNEQITDLLEPSSTNLQLREDMKKGVYVENLTEYHVRTVGDIVKLLLQGAANRKMAATCMNSESSRSHSVFTCNIESHWGKDSMTHFRFARLNLVDLAGSERQKSSGAEGDRLKEAANINKSLSTLGSASETLSTLKFAQRAKLIQNNAKVNEDASGDVTALQRQIQQLKKMKCMEAALAGALRREKLAEDAVRRLEAEIECMNRLAHQREEDVQRTKMMLRFREEKIKRLELLSDGSMSADKYLMEENNALLEEVQLLQSRIERNPELTRFALENIRLLEQLRLEVDELHAELRKCLTCSQSASDSVEDEVLQKKNTQKVDDASVMQHTDIEKELRDARMLIEAMESEQLRLIEELQFMQEENRRCMEMLSNKAKVEESVKLEIPCLETSDSEIQNMDLMNNLQVKLDRMTKDLENVKLKNNQYQEDWASQLCHEQQVELVREQVETETTRTILHLQEEVAALQLELHEKLCSMTEENLGLRNSLDAKENELRTLCGEWERATLELTNFLVDGSKSLKDASGQIESIASSFPRVNVWISEHVEKAAKVCIEKEETILLLQKSLEDAQKMAGEMELKLSSLKGATIALTEIQRVHNDESGKEAIQSSKLLDEKINMVKILESKLKKKEVQITEAENRANAAFLVVKKLSDHQHIALRSNIERDMDMSESALSPIMCSQQTSEVKTEADSLAWEEMEVQVQVARLGVLESENVINATYSDTELYLTALQTDILEASSLYRELVQDLMKDIDEMRKNFLELKEDCKNFQEAHTTIKEADFMLNALLKENENAKQVTGMWKQAGEEWLVEKASLIKEVEQLKSLIQLKEGENTVLQDHIHCSLVEMGDSMFFLEGFFLQMQKDVEERFRELYTAIISTGREILYSICNSRTSLEDIYSEIVEKEFALFVLYHCYIGEDFKRIIPGLNADHGFLRFGRQECNLVMNNLQKSCSSDEGNSMINGIEGIEEGDQSVAARDLEAELGQTSENLIYENLSLKKELERKEVLLKGLLFDFSLLQESASNKKDIKDETEKLILALSQVRCELEMKTSQLDDLLVQHRKLEGHLADTENALFISISDLEQAQESLDNLSDQNAELRVLLKDLYIKKSETEDQLEEQKDVIKGLEKEILRLTSSVEKKLMSSVEDIEDKLSRVTDERDGLHEEVCSLKDKLEMAYALADENEAIAVEARQESEASKIYAEQKEEEVKILEHSVEELECTINVLEKKVCEMDEEVERHRLIRNSLELELQALRQRMLTVESFTENTNVEQTEDQLSRQLYNISRELNEAHTRIRILEEERAERDKEIKQYKDYISELVLHAEAQASQYQQKYKTLEAMVREVKTDSSNSVSAALVQEKTEKSTMRTRGSSSPFRCIAGLVQQMNMEKDQELSMARLHIEELEELAANRQKEVCMLNTRLAAADSMTHDVIRDLLGVKLDMTNYADLIDQHQVLKLLEEAQQQTEESFAKEQEIRNLKKQIDDLIEERESCILEINSKKADIFAAQMTAEQLQERDHLLTAQNEMLKMDKTNLKRKIIELDEMVKKLFGTQNSQQQIPQSMKIKESGSLRLGDAGITKRVAKSEKLLCRVNDELAQYRRRTDEHSSYTKYRKQKGPI
uniref:Kinesin motor domain-containing protein n=1 Tax=Vitis vinifera TaxID=29760 RepID=F6HE33_VITVI